MKTEMKFPENEQNEACLREKPKMEFPENHEPLEEHFQRFSPEELQRMPEKLTEIVNSTACADTVILLIHFFGLHTLHENGLTRERFQKIFQNNAPSIVIREIRCGEDLKSFLELSNEEWHKPRNLLMSCSDYPQYDKMALTNPSNLNYSLFFCRHPEYIQMVPKVLLKNYLKEAYDYHLNEAMVTAGDNHPVVIGTIPYALKKALIENLDVSDFPSDVILASMEFSDSDEDHWSRKVPLVFFKRHYLCQASHCDEYLCELKYCDKKYDDLLDDFKFQNKWRNIFLWAVVSNQSDLAVALFQVSGIEVLEVKKALLAVCSKGTGDLQMQLMKAAMQVFPDIINSNSIEDSFCIRTLYHKNLNWDLIVFLLENGQEAEYKTFFDLFFKRIMNFKTRIPPGMIPRMVAFYGKGSKK